MKVTIVSPERVLFKGEADGVKVPGEKGRFEILKGHAPIISTLAAGEVVCSGAEPFTLAVKGVMVPIEECIRGFNMILDGEVDYLPEQAFLNVGTIDDAIEKGKRLLSNAGK